MQMTGHQTRSVFERYNVTRGAALKEAAKKLNQCSQQNASGMNPGMTAPKVNTPTEDDLPLTSATSMPGRGIEPLRPSRGSGF
jgi:hypothetical protein